VNHQQASNPPVGRDNLAAYQYALMNCMQTTEEELEERGQKCKTWDAAHIIFDSNQSMLFNFPDRKLNARYAVEEFLWYIRADKNDTSIEEHATMWKKLRQEDGSFASNYGHYIFAKMTPDGVDPFTFCYEQLVRNKHSRRAAIPLLETKHCFQDNPDMVCTFAIQFFVRRNRLVMIVNMRSNDAVWGLTNDAFCFSMLHRLMCKALRSHPAFTSLQLGEYHHIANTLHVYERHYEMASKIIETDLRVIEPIEVPMFTHDEAYAMLNKRTDNLSWTKFLDSLSS
jgi:thymidylate synthase